MTGNRTPVVTGIGLVTPAGASRRASWESISAGDPHLDAPTRVDPAAVEPYSVYLTGDVGDEEFDPPAAFDPRSMGRYTGFAMAAAREALDDADLSIRPATSDGEESDAAGSGDAADGEEGDPDAVRGDRVGVAVASAFGGLAELLAAHDSPGRASPYLAARTLVNLAAGHLGIELGARGPNRAPATACAAGTHAVDAAVTDLRRGRADAVLAGGTEAVLTPDGIAMTAAPRAYTGGDDPTDVRPFDADRDGLALGEAAAVLVLETREHVRERGLDPDDAYAAVTGVGATADAHHPVRPPDDGEGLRRAMAMALDEAGRSPGQVDHVNAHGTATVAGDRAEARAVADLLGEVPVTSVKGSIGHTYGAAGAVDAAVAALSVREGRLPATANFETPDEDVPVPVVADSRPADPSVVLSNSAGFGGTNGSIVLEREPPE